MPSLSRPIYAISDLHTDRVENLAWLRSERPWPADASVACAVVAGDISHRLDVLDETLRTLASRFARVFFVPGNHELWCQPEAHSAPTADSLAKFDAVLALCAARGVETAPALVGHVAVVPLFSWYDQSLALPRAALGSASPLPLRLWVDYTRCRWPSSLVAPDAPPAQDSAVCAHFLARNRPAIAAARAQMAAAAAASEGVRGVLSFSHFLPAPCCLPDWCVPDAPVFDTAWLSHGAARKAGLFASVAGSTALDAQLRSLRPDGETACEHVHVFGHSHRPKDFRLRGVRYVHNPVGKGTEREWRVLPSPAFVRLWDGNGNAVPRDRIIRYWAEVGKVTPRAAQ